MNSKVFGILTVMALLLTSAPVLGQQKKAAKKSKKKSTVMPQFSAENMLDDEMIDALLKQRSSNLAIELDLDAETEKKVHASLEQHWRGFFQKNRNQISRLVSDFYQSTLDEQDPSAPELQKWARQASRLHDQVMEEMDSSDTDIANIVGPDKAADYRSESAKMRLGLGLFRGQLTRWEAGDFSDSPWSRQQQARAATPTADISKRAKKVAQESQKTPELTFLTVSAWDRYVIDFISRYDLDGAQKERANAILADIKTRAQQHAKKYTDELDSSKKKLQAAKPDERAKIMKEQRTLLQPLQDLFSELQTRLDALPTAAQRAKVEPATKSKTPVKPAGKSKAKTPKPKTDGK